MPHCSIFKIPYGISKRLKGSIFVFGAENCIFLCNQSEVAGLLVSVAAAAARLVVVAAVRQRRAGVSAEEGFAHVCSRQSQAETTLRKGEGESRQVKEVGWRLSELGKEDIGIECNRKGISRINLKSKIRNSAE